LSRKEQAGYFARRKKKGQLNWHHGDSHQEGGENGGTQQVLNEKEHKKGQKTLTDGNMEVDFKKGEVYQRSGRQRAI